MPSREQTPIRNSEHEAGVLDHILLRIGAASAEEVQLYPAERTHSVVRLYRAMCRDRWAYVDRGLAIRLRERGAVWSGDVLRDPCAVA